MATVLGDPLTGVAEVTVRRVYYSPHLGHWGAAGYQHADEPPGVLASGIDPESMIGRPLPDGTVLRVTVEVVSEPDAEPKVSGWHRHDGSDRDARRWLMNTRSCDECNPAGVS